jgi:hypothetical protein
MVSVAVKPPHRPVSIVNIFFGVVPQFILLSF